MHAFDDFLVESREGAAIQLLVHHAVLLDRSEFRRGLRADDLERGHELRIGHFVRGPQAPGKVPGRRGAPDDFLRKAGEPVPLRHDHAQAGHRRLGIVTVPVRPVEDGGHLGEVRLLPELPFIRPRFREGLDPELVEEGHADRCDARWEG